VLRKKSHGVFDRNLRSQQFIHHITGGLYEKIEHIRQIDPIHDSDLGNGFGGSSFALAEEPIASSPSVQEEKGPSADAGEVQERGISWMPLGGGTVGKIGMDPVGFSWDGKSKPTFQP
jgi:hypothetical protein